MKKWMISTASAIALVILAMAATASPGAAQCGDCVGAPGIAHVFPEGEAGADGNRLCDIEGVPEPAGCHTDWYLPGCGVHDSCLGGEEQDLLAAAITHSDVDGLAKLMATLDQTFEFDDRNRAINAMCDGLLVARFPLPDAVEPRAFATALGLLD